MLGSVSSCLVLSEMFGRMVFQEAVRAWYRKCVDVDRLGFRGRG